MTPPHDPLAPWRTADLDLPGLVAAATALLSRCPPPTDERVSALPDERTIRYYQTSGLIDRPARYEGRTARYGLRHLLQACCVKLLQGQGLSLGQIQQALAGVPDGLLESALRQGLGMGAPVAPPAPSPVARSWLEYELAPGVRLLLDPSLVPDPAGLVQRILLALSSASSPLSPLSPLSHN